jgi:hypothetical protein
MRRGFLPRRTEAHQLPHAILIERLPNVDPLGVEVPPFTPAVHNHGIEAQYGVLAWSIQEQI